MVSICSMLATSRHILTLHNYLLRAMVLVCSILWVGKWSSERLGDFPKSTELLEWHSEDRDADGVVLECEFSTTAQLSLLGSCNCFTCPVSPNILTKYFMCTRRYLQQLFWSSLLRKYLKMNWATLSYEIIKDQFLSNFFALGFAALSPKIYLWKQLNGISQNHLENGPHKTFSPEGSLEEKRRWFNALSASNVSKSTFLCKFFGMLNHGIS